MPPLSRSAGVTLAETIDHDDVLYRTAQALLALASAPGRRNLRLAQQDGRWLVYGMTASITEFSPPTLSLDAGLSHRSHLHAILLAPLAVETPQFTTNIAAQTTYAVPRGGLPDLFTATRALAGALDGHENAGEGPWWGRRARQEAAARQLETALQGLREASTQVQLVLLR